MGDATHFPGVKVLVTDDSNTIRRSADIFLYTLLLKIHRLIRRSVAQYEQCF